MAGKVRLIPLNLLRTYAVQWDEETFVRDIWQNFFDASVDFKGVTCRATRRSAGSAT
jgi:hypothetical protein